jgi:hypothetical protein
MNKKRKSSIVTTILSIALLILLRFTNKIF